MKKLLKILFFFTILVIQMAPVKCDNVTKVDNLLNKMDLEKYNNLMIVAHPDDEALWGGAELLKDDYLVVCVTCGDNKERQKEFETALKFTNDVGLSLHYNDTVGSDSYYWAYDYENIKNDVKDIIDYKNWNKIVTHNKKGEYGHYHHKVLSRIVTSVAPTNVLYYFNHYYTAEELDMMNYCIPTLSENEMAMKNVLLDIYKSQKSIIDYHYENVKYEKLIKYEDYKE